MYNFILFPSMNNPGTPIPNLLIYIFSRRKQEQGVQHRRPLGRRGRSVGGGVGRAALRQVGEKAADLERLRHR